MYRQVSRPGFIKEKLAGCVSDGRVVLCKFHRNQTNLLWLLGAVSWIVALPTVALWLITLCFAFRTGKAAFGMGSAMIYLFLVAALFCWPGLFLFLRMVHLDIAPWIGMVLLLWPGLFVIPHMIRLDIQRAYDIGLDDNEVMEPERMRPVPPSTAPRESTGIQSLHRNRGNL